MEYSIGEYSDKDLTWIAFIKRLKDTGMPIKEIRHYAELRADGDPTLSERMEMLVFQFFRALPVGLPDCFLLLQLFLYCVVLDCLYNDILPDFLGSQHINPVDHK